MAPIRHFSVGIILLGCLIGCQQQTTTTGTIQGVVHWIGPEPKPRPLFVSEPECRRYWESQGTKGPPDERFLFGSNHTLQNVLVYITAELKKHPNSPDRVKHEPATLQAIHCRYVPHVLAVQVYQPVHFINVDSWQSTFHVLPRTRANRSYKVGMPTDRTIKRVFAATELGVPVRCDTFPWLSAYIHILDHPYHDVTGESGTFEIRNVPPGEYDLSVWHEFKRFKPDQETIKVRVEAGKVTKAAFTYRVKPRDD